MGKLANRLRPGTVPTSQILDNRDTMNDILQVALKCGCGRVPSGEFHWGACDNVVAVTLPYRTV
jgi:hypothetical protein